jgi:hypothetical protein
MSRQRTRAVCLGKTDPEGAEFPRDRRQRFAKTALEVKKQLEELLKTDRTGEYRLYRKAKMSGDDVYIYDQVMR